jgi:hypothetical protein
MTRCKAGTVRLLPPFPPCIPALTSGVPTHTAWVVITQVRPVSAVHPTSRLLHPWFARLRWPLPALLAWAAAWLVWAVAGTAPLPSSVAFALATLAGAVLAWPCTGLWRQSLSALGFPLSAMALDASAGLPAWGWLLMLLALLAAYPLRAWHDAPFFPTPADALQGVNDIVGQPLRVLDAGCGLGHGLTALRQVWPQAALQGVEWSAPLAWGAKLRCRLTGLQACVWRGDMWDTPWSGQDLVYAFQRPESMPRVFAKAARELSPGAWLLSLEFEVPGQRATARLQRPGRKPLWLYQPAGKAVALAPRSTPTAASR